MGGNKFDRESPYIWPNSCCRAQRGAALVLACDQSEHVSSAQSAQHFEERNVVTVNALSITIKSLTKVEARRAFKRRSISINMFANHQVKGLFNFAVTLPT